ncbi:hypothetical protein KGF57_004286 [Candida theae]|uniref:FAD/NAD(P)-binding domain-containing protein n=1 Tax=Candida theae TaxID=1198502 RepID=A0AAD5FWX9_9ASCO|nr:uncharacterized protein KGF57_004286 [Candida theae]KAI5950471.1 hypothetical protein KGF57_004286 [Candida theae]
MSSTKQVIIVGGSYAAILALKTLLAATKAVKLDITVVAPNEKAFFNICVPRLLIENVSIEKIAFPLGESINNLVQGTIHRAIHIQSSVTQVDFNKKSVTIADGSELTYDNLILASGARSVSPIWKLDSIKDIDYTLDSIKEASAQIKNAKSIAIIGGGTTGVETAGELGHEFKGGKEIVLYTGSSGPLSKVLPNHVSSVTDKLKKLNIEIVNNQLVKKQGKSTIALEDGTTRDFDVILEAYKLLPNTEYLPQEVLDKRSYVITDEFFRLRDHHEVICLGDILALGQQSLVDLTYNQKPVFTKTVSCEVFGDSSVKLAPYVKPTKATVLVPIGRDGGVGAVFGFSIPSFVVWLAKSRNFVIPKAPGFFT